MSKRDELAALLGEHRGIHCGTYATCSCGRLIADMDSHPMGDYAADHERHIADAVLAWLDGQFGEGLLEAVAREFWPAGPGLLGWDGAVMRADAALAVVRKRLGLDGAAQDAQEGAQGSARGATGSGSGGSPVGRENDTSEIQESR